MPGEQFYRSIRFRIAAWTSLAVAAIAILALFGLRQSIRWTLNHEVDQVLLEDGKEVQLVVQELAGKGLDAVTDELRRKATGHAQHRWFVQLFTAEDSVVWASNPVEASDIEPNDEPLRTLGEFRLHRTKVPSNLLGVTHAQIGASLAPLRDDLQRIDRIVLGASALLLLLAPLCGYWLSGLATRDLAAMTARAASLRPAKLDERLPESGVGDELDRLARTINRLLDRIAKFIEEKRVFLANAAHELRTPLAALRSSAEVAISRDRSADEYRVLIEDLIENSESLEVLVNQVLLLSEATVSEDMAPRVDVPLADVVQRSLDMFSGVAEARGVELTGDLAPGVQVRGLRNHLGQVINNLIDNALKHTPEGGQVRVTLTKGSRDRAQLIVEDTGVGIDPEDVPRVFDRFFRTDRSRTCSGPGGAGLGLSICKSIVEAHGGQILCRSHRGSGTCIDVLLPCSPTQQGN